MDHKLKAILAAVFGIETETLTDYSSHETIDTWDSLTHMNMISALEEEFKVHFEDEEILQMINYPAVREILSQKLNAAVANSGVQNFSFA